MSEKKAYAILKVFEMLDYMSLVEDNTHLFTDHQKLLVVYSPEELVSIGQYFPQMRTKHSSIKATSFHLST